MNLYKRDYSKVLCESEQKLHTDFEKYNNIKGLKSAKKDPRHSYPEFETRKFLWCYNLLFPNISHENLNVGFHGFLNYSKNIKL